MAAPTSATPRPRVWTVFVAYVAFMLLNLAYNLGFGAAVMLRDGVRFSDREAVEQAIEHLMDSFAVLAGTLAGSLTLLIAFALVGAAVAPGPWRRRLRWLPWTGGLGVVGLLVVSDLGLSASVGALVAMVRTDSSWTGARLAQTLQALPAAQYAAMTVLVGLIGPVAEELFFRGFVQTRLRDRWGSWPGIVVTALLFGLYHLDPTHIVVATTLGLLIGWVAEVTGSILPCIAMHIANNLMAAVLARVSPPPTHGVSSPGVALVIGAGVTSALCVALARRKLHTEGRSAAP